MKIAIFNAYQGIVYRGAERFVEELSKRLQKKHKVVIFSDRRYPLKRWPIIWRVFLDPAGIYIFWFTLKNIFAFFRNKFEVVIPLNGGWQPALLRIATWLYGGKVVISGQSGIGWDDKNNLWCFPDCFVALSSYAKNWAGRVCPFVKVKYIPNGVDLEKFKPGDKKLNTYLKRPIVLCVAALVASKRIDLTIKAVSRIPNASLVVVGRGPLKRTLENLCRKLLKDRFRLMELSFEEMPNIYREADVFTLCSESQHSFEIALLEALASNLPVVTNDDPIRREIVGRAGLLVNPEDTEAYSKALEKAFQISWGDKPRKQAQKFSWDKIVSKYENLFLEILGK